MMLICKGGREGGRGKEGGREREGERGRGRQDVHTYSDFIIVFLLVVVQYSGRLRTGSHAPLLQYNGRTVSCLFIVKIILTSSSIWVGLK